MNEMPEHDNLPGSPGIVLEIQGEALAPDGMELTDFATIEASDPAHLPPDSAIGSRVRSLAERLDA